MRSTSPHKPLDIDLWHVAENPRERVLQHAHFAPNGQGGACQLSAVDLISVCLGHGIKGENVQAMAQRLLQQFGGVEGLLNASPAALLACPGLGKARVALLKAVQELTRRHDESCLSQPQALEDAAAVVRYLRRQIGYQAREMFGCLFLDTRHRPICWEVLFLGSLNKTHVHSREVLRRGLELNAAAVILGHNHPSGIAEPSSADLNLTLELKSLLAKVDIVLLDHIVVSAVDAVSMANRGLISAQPG